MIRFTGRKVRVLQSRRTGRLIRAISQTMPLPKIKRTKRTKRTFATAVKRVLDRNLEHKHKSWEIGNNLPFNPDISGADVLPLVGPVAQGTGGNQRVGMRVKPMSILVKGTMHYDSAVGGCETIRPVLYFLNSRQLKTNAGIIANAAAISNQLLDNWDGANARFDGTLERLAYPVNLDDYTVIRVMKLSITKDNTTSSDGKSYVDFTVKLPHPAQLHFDEGSTYASNYAPFVAIGWCKSDGGAPDTGETTPWLQATFRTYMSYVDA